jgi:uncharacterized membrane protein
MVAAVVGAMYFILILVTALFFFILDGSTSWSKILGNISFVVWMNIMDRTRLMAVLGPNQ